MDDIAVDISDFRFQRLRKIRLDKWKTQPLQSHLKLIATSNLVGLCVVALDNNLIFYSLSDIHQFDVTTKELADVEVTDCPVVRVIQTAHQIVGVDISCDSTVLAVCSQRPNVGTVVSMLDLRSVLSQGDAKFLCDVRLSKDFSIQLTDFKWNPSLPGNFTFCCSDGTAGVIQLKESGGFTIEGSQQFQNGVTCGCWSPKGKQIVFGHSDGSFGQYKTSLQLVKAISAPTTHTAVVGVFWLSTHEFLVAYYSAADKRTVVHLVVTSKDHPAQHINLEEICFASLDQPVPRYNFCAIHEWNVVICSMANSADVGVLGLNGEKKRWQIWNLDGNGRADLPTTKDGNDSFPCGLALDFTPSKNIRLDESRSLPPMPILLVMSTDGVLLPYHVVNCRPNVSLLNKPAEVSVAGSQQRSFGAVVPVQENKLVVQPPTPFVQPISSIVQPPPPLESPSLVNVRKRSENHSATQSQSAVVTTAVVLTPSADTSDKERQQEEERRMNIVFNTATVEEMVAFQRELKDLKKSLSVDQSSLGTEEELCEVSQSLNEVEKQTDELAAAMKDLQLNAAALRSECFDSIANAEEAKLRHKRRSLPEYRLLMRSMPLDSDLEKKLRRIRLGVNQVQDTLDNTTAKLSSMKRPTRLGMPSRPMQLGQNDINVIYKTAANMQSVINEQSLRISSLKNQLMKLQTSGNNKTDGLTSLFERSVRLTEEAAEQQPERLEKLSQSITHAAGVGTMTATTSRRLRDYLSSRTEVPHYSASPSDLSEIKLPAYKRVKELQQQMLAAKESAKPSKPKSNVFRTSAGGVPATVSKDDPQKIAVSPVKSAATATSAHQTSVQTSLSGFRMNFGGKAAQPAIQLSSAPKAPPVSSVVSTKSDSPLAALQQFTQSSSLFGQPSESTTKTVQPTAGIFGAATALSTPSQPKVSVPVVSVPSTTSTSQPSTLAGFSFNTTTAEKPVTTATPVVPSVSASRQPLVDLGSTAGLSAKPTERQGSTELRADIVELTPAPTVSHPTITQPNVSLPAAVKVPPAPATTIIQPTKTVSTAPVTLDLQPKAIVTSAATDTTVKTTTFTSAAEFVPSNVSAVASPTTAVSSAPVASTVVTPPSTTPSLFGTAAKPQIGGGFIPAAQSTPIGAASKPLELVSRQSAILEDGEMEEVKENNVAAAATAPSSSLASFSFTLPVSTAPVPTSTAPLSIFGSPAQTGAGGFGGAASFGGGGFGLGGPPNPANLNRNPFGGSVLGGGSTSTQTQSLFGGGGSQQTFGRGFGSPSTGGVGTTFGTPAGSAFTSSSSSVLTSGFGAAPATTTQGFGSASGFGGGPAFGAAPAFGSASSFGSGQSVFGGGGIASPAGSNSVFGGAFQSSGGGGGFAAFARADAPSFGALSGSQPATFGGFGAAPSSAQQPSGFGQSVAFGSTTFGSPSAFGGGQQQNTSGGSPAFTQFRG